MRQVPFIYTTLLMLSIKQTTNYQLILKFLKASWKRHSAWSVRFRIFLVRFFPHSDWIWRDTYLTVFRPNVGKYRPEKLPIQTLFTQRTSSKIQKWFSSIHANVIWKSSVSNNWSKHMFINIDFRNFDHQYESSATGINSNHGNISSLWS